MKYLNYTALLFSAIYNVALASPTPPQNDLEIRQKRFSDMIDFDITSKRSIIEHARDELDNNAQVESLISALLSPLDSQTLNPYTWKALISLKNQVIAEYQKDRNAIERSQLPYYYMEMAQLLLKTGSIPKIPLSTSFQYTDDLEKNRA